jgi:hypothetical protein
MNGKHSKLKVRNYKYKSSIKEPDIQYISQYSYDERAQKIHSFKKLLIFTIRVSIESITFGI